MYIVLLNTLYKYSTTCVTEYLCEKCLIYRFLIPNEKNYTYYLHARVGHAAIC